MLTNMQKIGMAIALLFSCIVLALVAFSAGWDHMPDDQKEWLVTAGYWVTAALAIGAAIYCVAFTALSWKETLDMIDQAEYNQRIANQFNVGACISPQNWLDVDDYRRLANGSRK